MLSTTSNSELVSACQILFSPDANMCSVDFIKALEPSTLKKVYRKKALETHPDRYGSSGLNEAESGEQFRKVKSAYETLKPVAAGTATVKPNNKNDKKPPGNFYEGSLPFHKLLFGQFLYYSGTITWKTLMQAIVWQRNKKTAYGQIALHWEMLSTEDIAHIMQNKKFNEKFGEYAKKYDYLTIFQHLAIMGKQQSENRLFGEYFIKKGILSKRQVDNLVQKTINHNDQIANNS